MSAFPFFPHLQGIFYAEFHPTQGPKVNFEHPEGLTNTHSSALSVAHSPSSIAPNPAPLSSATTLTIPSGNSPLAHNLTSPSTYVPNPSSSAIIDFDAISDYIIPKPELCDRLLTISTLNKKVVSYPVSIHSQKYERNVFIFNLVFIFLPSAPTATYNPVVKKMATYLKNVEVEYEFLSRSNDKVILKTILEQLRDDLNILYECQISLTSTDKINLKLFPQRPPPEPVHDYHVPIALVKLNDLIDLQSDWTLRRILPHIDGVQSVKHIALMADVERSLVRSALQHLLYYGAIKLMDIFQYSNMYAVSADVSKLLDDERFQQTCVEYVSKSTEKKRPSFTTLFCLYCSLKHGLTLRIWINENKSLLLDIDVRRFIVFGVLNQVIFRIHRYPVLTNRVKSMMPQKLLNRFLDGTHHYDEICTYYGYSVKQLDELLLHDASIKFLWK